MTLRREDSTLLECRRCEVTEDGTVAGRFTYDPLPYAWGGELITFIDHGEVDMPSPALG